MQGLAVLGGFGGLPVRYGGRPLRASGRLVRGENCREKCFDAAYSGLFRPKVAQGGPRWPNRRTGRRLKVAQAAPLKTARGPQRPAHPARRYRLILALGHHGAILARLTRNRHRIMDRGRAHHKAARLGAAPSSP